MKQLKKLKPLLLCSFVFVILLVGGLVFSGCNKKHEHSVQTWETTLAATCTEDGQRKGECTICGEEITEVIPKLGHKVIKLEATVTCTEDGLSEGEKCEVCQTILKAQEPVSALGHDYGGYEQIPDDDISDDFTYHKRTCNTCGFVEEERCGYINDVHKPTCTEDGYTIHICTKCDRNFKHDLVDATGHNYDRSSYSYVKPGDDGYVVGRHRHKRVCINPDCGHELIEDCQNGEDDVHQPTCTAMGYTTHTCELCEHSYDDTEVNMLPHTYAAGDGWEANPVASHTDNHTHTRTCTVCGTTETGGCQVVVDDQAATCDRAQTIRITCTICGRDDTHTIGEKLEHIYEYKHNGAASKGESKHYQRCTLCGNETEHVACDFVDSTLVEQTCDSAEVTQSVCQFCLYSYDTETAQMLGHDWDEEHWHMKDDGKCYCVCKNNPEHTKEQEHVFDDALVSSPDCVNPGSTNHTCRFCEYQYSTPIEALGHSYATDESAWNITAEGHIHKCIRQGCKTVFEREAHTFVETNFCDSCGFDGIEYKKEENHYIVFSGYRVRDAKKIIIPEMHAENGEGALPVKAITSGVDGTPRAFLGARMQDLVLPRNLETIGNLSFKNCRYLKTVTINTEVEGLEETTAKLKTLGTGAFLGCSSLTSIELPSSLTTIGNSAFNNCSSLRDITIPDSVIDIQQRAFDGTALYNDPEKWTENVLYIGDHLIRANANVASEYVITVGTVNISVEAFKGCTNLTKLTIPGSVIEIDADAFTGCTSLNEVVFTGTFDQWIGIKFGNSDSSPMNFATILTISGATGQITTIPEGTTKIPVGTFKNNKNISSIKIPSSVIEIGEEAFYGCSNLETIDATGCNLKIVGKDAFTGSKYYDTADNWDAETGALYIGNCLIKTNGTVKDVTLKENTYSIAAEAFDAATERIVIAETVIYIGENAFTACAGLKSVKFNRQNGWMAFNSHGIGRGVDDNRLNGDEANVGYVKSYVGIWSRGV